MSVHSAQTQAKLQIMMQYIHDNYSGQITLDDIARTVLISKSSVLNIFRTYLHTSPINYVVEYRLKRASKLLVDTENSVCTIAHETGFENIGYFCRRFKKAVRRYTDILQESLPQCRVKIRYAPIFILTIQPQCHRLIFLTAEILQVVEIRLVFYCSFSKKNHRLKRWNKKTLVKVLL